METTFFQTREGDRVVSEIEFGADQKDGGSWSVVPDFGDPLAGAREGISVEQRRGGREHGKDLLSIFQNVFFFLTMIYKCKDQRSTKRENGQLLIALLNEKRFLARLIPPESINPRLH